MSDQGARVNLVENGCIILRTKTALPKRCVRCNQSVSDREYKIHDLLYFPKWLIALMIVSPIFLLAAPFAVRRRCKLKFGLTSRIGLAAWGLRLVAGVVLVTAMVAQTYFGLIGDPLPYAVALLLVIVSVIAVFVWTPILRIVRCDEERFWIKGCSQEFLDELDRTPTPRTTA